MSEVRRALLLMGPTGVGKSDLAIALAERLPFEIVSVDSALVYRGMDIGTAKPDVLSRRRVPHHLIDILEPESPYSAGDFVRDAARAMQDIWQRDRVPLLAGGTMLYYNALIQGIAALPERDSRIRADIDARAEQRGWPEVHRELTELDPVAAARIHPNDAQRIQRALEVFMLTGERMSSLQLNRRSSLHGIAVRRIACLPPERAVLHERLRRRFERMIELGFVDEVRVMRERKTLTAEHPSMRAVGYRQVWQHLAGQSTLQEASEQAIAATRQLAKRQMTWLRAMDEIQWVDFMHRDAASIIEGALSEGGHFEWT